PGSRAWKRAGSRPPAIWSRSPASTSRWAMASATAPTSPPPGRAWPDISRGRGTKSRPHLFPGATIMTNATDFFDMSTAPRRAGTGRLKVRVRDAVSGFYQRVLGLTQIAKTDRRAVLGTGKTPLLVLEADPALTPGDRRQAGLFHTAFLMPTRADLAHWVR